MKETKSIIYSSFWTTILFLVLQLTGITAFSWWWLLATFFVPPVAWIAGIVWLISLILG